MLGAQIKVQTLQGDKDVKIEPGTASDAKITLKSQGMQKLPPN
jgi:DnaJ-class molecular chaperone